MITRERKAERTVGERWSAILVPWPTASNTGIDSFGSGITPKSGTRSSLINISGIQP
jgi:hypothetical protein